MRLATAALAALAALATAPPAEGAAPRGVTLYLTQTSESCGASVYAITTSAADGRECSVFPRAQYDDTGIVNEKNEHFTGQPRFRVDARRRVTGVFSLTNPGPLTGGAMPSGIAGLVAADLTIKIGSVSIGTVRVEGTTTPNAPVQRTFSFAVPARLDRVAVSAASVAVRWRTCAGPAACAVRVSGPDHSRFVVPVR